MCGSVCVKAIFLSLGLQLILPAINGEGRPLILNSLLDERFLNHRSLTKVCLLGAKLFGLIPGLSAVPACQFFHRRITIALVKHPLLCRQTYLVLVSI
jgi:hypothetical protein